MAGRDGQAQQHCQQQAQVWSFWRSLMAQRTQSARVSRAAVTVRHLAAPPTATSHQQCGARHWGVKISSDLADPSHVASHSGSNTSEDSPEQNTLLPGSAITQRGTVELLGMTSRSTRLIHFSTTQLAMLL